MVDIDIGEHGGARTNGTVARVALVGFDDEGSGTPVCAVGQLCDVGTDQIAGVAPGRAQHEGKQRRGRGLAVRAGHRDGVVLRTDPPEHLGTRLHLDCETARRTQFGVVGRHRRGIRHDVATAHDRVVVRHVHPYP